MNNYMDDFYEKRLDDMKKMRFDEGKTNTEIGGKYGISRERVRQLIGNTGRLFRQNWTKKLIQSGEIKLNHWTELENAPGVRKEWIRDWGNHRHVILKPGSVRTGYIFEELASRILKDWGIENECMPFRYPYDIVTE